MFDILFDRLVKVRHRMAKMMGFDSYIPLAYMNLNRTDYTPEDVNRFRQQILNDCVPVCSQLHEEQKKNLKLDAFCFYDEKIHFINGNAKLTGNSDHILHQAGIMYNELSQETGNFFSIMKDNELLDLVTKKNKTPGGYCTFLPDYDVPFIFSNFNGTEDDVVVLTHEAGHAFQVWLSNKKQIVREYRWSSPEISEIHSMSMEFFTYPWMNKFFGDTSEKFTKSHIVETIIFIPYSACVDEFQHQVYEKPYLSPDQRKKIWRDLEKKYLSSRNYDHKKIFDDGAFFFKQMHIFMAPFYYIDYTLASLGAVEFYRKAQNSFKTAWNDYLHLCELGGSKSYFKLINETKLENPLSEGSIKKTLAVLLSKLNK